jgi:nucleotide-binding universal stress UspA family protein
VRQRARRLRGLRSGTISVLCSTVYKNILVATDGSTLSERAVAYAIDLARALAAGLTVFHARPDRVNEAHLDGINLDAAARQRYTETDTANAQRILGAAASQIEAAGVPCTVLHDIAWAPHEGILAAAAKHQCDAIVMASHGRRGVSQLLLGCETQKVLSETTLPVLVVR